MKNVISVHFSDAHIVQNDPWYWFSEKEITDEFAVMSVPDWLAMNEENRSKGVVIQDDDEMEKIAPFLSQLALVALRFNDFKDGRPYSLAYVLRLRLKFAGELRAVGDVLRDQLSLMRQCGFTSFAIKEGKDPKDALLGIKGISVTYSSSVSQPSPLYRRVRRS